MGVRIKILKQLLCGEKCTAEIAKALGYVDQKGEPKYNNVTPLLNSLYSQGLLSRAIKKKDKGPGPRKTYWNIKEDYKTLKKLWEKYTSRDYPALRERLTQHTGLMKYYPSLLVEEVERKLCRKLTKQEKSSVIKVVAEAKPKNPSLEAAIMSLAAVSWQSQHVETGKQSSGQLPETDLREIVTAAYMEAAQEAGLNDSENQRFIQLVTTYITEYLIEGGAHSFQVEVNSGDLSVKKQPSPEFWKNARGLPEDLTNLLDPILEQTLGCPTAAQTGAFFLNSGEQLQKQLQRQMVFNRKTHRWEWKDSQEPVSEYLAPSEEEEREAQKD